MFEDYPKKRITLPEELRRIHAELYKKNREGATVASSLSQKMEAWLHRRVASDVTGNENKSTLEIGAGTLNQLQYERTQPYDIVEPFRALHADSPFLSRINRIYDDIDEIDLATRYDRITSIASFEHILDLPRVVARSCVLLNKTGVLRVSIPNEGSVLWSLGWRLTTGLEFRMKYGMDYGTLMRYEHVNSANEIEEVLKYFYEDVKCSFFGLNKRLALYRFYECGKPKIDLARQYDRFSTAGANH